MSSVDYGDGTLLDQCCSFHNVISLGFGQVESRLSQNLSEKAKNCHKEGSNSRSMTISLAPDHYANCKQEKLGLTVI